MERGIEQEVKEGWKREWKKGERECEKKWERFEKVGDGGERWVMGKENIKGVVEGGGKREKERSARVKKWERERDRHTERDRYRELENIILLQSAQF